MTTFNKTNAKKEAPQKGAASSDIYNYSTDILVPGNKAGGCANE